VRFAAAELRDQHQDRRSILRFAIQSPHDDADVLAKSACPAGAREKLLWIAIIERRRSRDNTLQRDREFIRIK